MGESKRRPADLTAIIDELREMNEKMLKGARVLLDMEDIDVAPTIKQQVLQVDKMRVYHYTSPDGAPCPIPMLIVYALVNRQYMMDLQSDRSLIKNLIAAGIDIYIIDWGYPDPGDRWITLEDYIDGYLNDAVDKVREVTGHDKINLLGVCQGGTFAAIYASLYPEKLQSLVTMVAPFDFSTDEGLLNVWSRYMPIDQMVDVMGVVPGELMNVGFLMLKPFQLMVDKYVGLMENLDDRFTVENFVRMEKWIFDSPAQAGEAYRKFLKELYQENLLVKGEFMMGDRKADLKNITMPVLNIYALEDHLVPPAASRPLLDLVGSEKKEEMAFPGGHIGLYVSGRSQRELAPRIASFIEKNCELPQAKAKARAARPKTVKQNP
ncbi:MAG: class III poly(R)-hydroxyalkanoic acid synthase subunit PhaC [Candidatus Geothermincolia bacterium]